MKLYVFYNTNTGFMDGGSGYIHDYLENDHRQAIQPMLDAHPYRAVLYFQNTSMPDWREYKIDLVMHTIIPIPPGQIHPEVLAEQMVKAAAEEAASSIIAGYTFEEVEAFIDNQLGDLPDQQTADNFVENNFASLTTSEKEYLKKLHGIVYNIHFFSKKLSRTLLAILKMNRLSS